MELEDATLLLDFVSEAEEMELLRTIDAREWEETHKRRTQHYGYRYKRSKPGTRGAGSLEQATDLRELGPTFCKIKRRLDKTLGRVRGRRAVPAGWAELADQVLVSEYQPGQGAASQTDPPLFASHVALLSLGADCELELERDVPGQAGSRASQRLPRRSLLVIYGDARYLWRRGIAARKSDVVDGRRMLRARRVLVTFRKIISHGMFFRQSKKRMPKPSLFTKGNLRATHGEKGLDGKIPLQYVLDHIAEKLDKNEAELAPADRLLVLRAETGSGKTTALMYELSKFAQQRAGRERSVLVTQPRVLTASEKAVELDRRSDIYPGMELGRNLGYSTGPFKEEPEVGLIYATLGVLMARLRAFEPAHLIAKYSFLVVDEAHETSVDLYLTLYYLRKFLKNNCHNPRCPFVIIMSATIDASKYAKYLGGKAKDTIHVAGLSNEIVEHWAPNSSGDVLASAVAKVRELHAGPCEPDRGDILVFVPGEAEMDRLKGELMRAALPEVDLVTLTGAIVSAGGPELDRLRMPLADLSTLYKRKVRRRVVLATVVAETGVTIESLRHCIDIGWSRLPTYFPPRDVSLLLTRPESRAAMIQRKGRVGRVFPGDFYPLFTQASAKKLPEYNLSALESEDLTLLMMALLAFNAQKGKRNKLHPPKLLDPPPAESVRAALRRLTYLGFLDEERGATPLLERGALLLSSVEQAEQLKLLLSSYVWQVSLADAATLAIFAVARRGEYVVEPQKGKSLTSAGAKYEPLFNLQSAAQQLSASAAWQLDAMLGDQLTEPLIIVRIFEQLVRALPLEQAVDRLVDLGIRPFGVARLIAARDELLGDLPQAGFMDVWPHHSDFHALIRDGQLLDYATRVRRCIYEGYKMNLAQKDALGVHRTRFGDQIIPPRDLVCSRFVYVRASGRARIPSPVYQIFADKVCVLDGFF